MSSEIRINNNVENGKEQDAYSACLPIALKLISGQDVGNLSEQARAMLAVIRRSVDAFSAEQPVWMVARRWVGIGPDTFAQQSLQISKSGWRDHVKNRGDLKDLNLGGATDVKLDYPENDISVFSVDSGKALLRGGVSRIVDSMGDMGIGKPDTYVSLLSWLMDEQLIDDNGRMTINAEKLLDELLDGRDYGEILKQHQALNRGLARIATGELDVSDILTDDVCPGLSEIASIIDEMDLGV